MLLHELVEIFLRVLAARIGGEHLVEVGHHVLDGLHRGRRLGRPRLHRLHRLLHAAKLCVENFLAKQILQLLIRCAGLIGSPVIFRQRANRPRRI